MGGGGLGGGGTRSTLNLECEDNVEVPLFSCRELCVSKFNVSRVPRPSGVELQELHEEIPASSDVNL